MQLAWSLGKVADTLTSFALLSWIDPAKQQPTFDAGADALRRLAGILAATPANQAARNDLPVLALSGGAANGAFTAGFLFELLAVRGLALERMIPRCVMRVIARRVLERGGHERRCVAGAVARPRDDR